MGSSITLKCQSETLLFLIQEIIFACQWLVCFVITC